LPLRVFERLARSLGLHYVLLENVLRVSDLCRLLLKKIGHLVHLLRNFPHHNHLPLLVDFKVLAISLSYLGVVAKQVDCRALNDLVRGQQHFAAEVNLK